MIASFISKRKFIVAVDPKSGEEVARTELIHPHHVNAERAHVARTAQEITIPAGSILELRSEDCGAAA